MTDAPDGPSGPRRAGGPFTVMAKPIGPRCNLDCRYCYYTEKQRLYPRNTGLRMSDETVEVFVRDYMTSQAGPEITFVWQGGEPTLLGLAFFEKVVELQRRHRPEAAGLSRRPQSSAGRSRHRTPRFGYSFP